LVETLSFIVGDDGRSNFQLTIARTSNTAFTIARAETARRTAALVFLTLWSARHSRRSLRALGCV
jgi:hypothetical protein